MANPQRSIFTAAGVRTVEAKGSIVDVVYRVSEEATPILDSFPMRGVPDQNPGKIEDDLQAISSTNYHIEGAGAPAASSSARTKNTNWCQLLMKSAEVSDQQAATAQYGVDNELDYQTMLRMIELRKDVEAFIISDQAVQAPTPANGLLAKMKGMSAIIATNTDLVANFNQVNTETLIRTAVVTYGANPTEVWMDATRKNAVAAWTTSITRYSTDTKLLIEEVQRYNSKIGQNLNFHLHKLMPKNYAATAAVVFGLDMGPQANWELLEFLPLTTEDISRTGASRARWIQWQLCVLPGVEKANFAFVG